MITIINAGGEGTRLWPLSSSEKPKHILKLTGGESLLQKTYQRLKLLGSTIYIVTETSHAALAKQQLPDLPEDHFIIEPARRGTAGCIVAGLRKVAARHGRDEPVVFLHADHAVRDSEGFVRCIQAAAAASDRENRVVLVGVKPSYPSTGLGYIRMGKPASQDGLVYEVAGYVEKPPLEDAARFMESGQYLWNCGYFVGTVAAFENDLKDFAPKWYAYYQTLLEAKTEEEFTKAYLNMETDTIDYALSERDDRLLAVAGTFDWSDIGNFLDLYASMQSDADGNVTESDAPVVPIDVKNSLIINKTGLPIGVAGLEGLIVVATENGILVVNKDNVQNVKTIVTKLRENGVN